MIILMMMLQFGKKDDIELWKKLQTLTTIMYSKQMEDLHVNMNLKNEPLLEKTEAILLAALLGESYCFN